MTIDPVNAFEFASKTVTQVMGLSSAILALTITFAKEQLAKDCPNALWPLKVSWIFEILSLLAGAWSLMAITGQIASPKITNPSIWALQITIPAGIQVISFLVAMIALLVAGWRSFK